jgi:circadian clock protein KaiC
VELDEVVDLVIEAIREHQPRCMVLDSLSELRVMVDNPYQLRRQLIKLKHALADVPCTALITAGQEAADQAPTIHTIVHGLIRLHHITPSYGEPRRQIEVNKIRGVKFSGGLHDFRITTGGIRVHPRPSVDQPVQHGFEPIASGNEQLDKLFGGGLNRGTTCLVTGNTGAGKSTLASTYAATVMQADQTAVIYCFDEGRQTYLQRSRGLKLGISDYLDSDRTMLREYGFGEMVPARFLEDLAYDVEQRDVRLVVLDSFTGYLNLMKNEESPVTKLHELLRYLSDSGVLTLLIGAAHGLSSPMSADLDASYLADTVVLMRHFEAMGTVRQCISVLKKRHGPHERTIREVEFVEGGLRVGPALSEFSGVLTGTPRYEGDARQLLYRNEDQSHDTE